MKAKLYNAILKHSNIKYPYHMPGHKFGRAFNLKNLPLLALDATEVEGLDNLYNAQGIIKQAMQDMARFYGSKKCIFLTNGATAGILTALLTVCKPKDKMIVVRNAHQSVINGLILADAIPIYISPKILPCGIIGEVDKNNIIQVLKWHPDIKGAIITSPTYEGIISDIEGIRKILGNRILIIDEAHGAHLNISPNFPKSAIHVGADIVINSMHKTLPALGQSALLHLCTNKIKYDDLIKNLSIIQTSSPSYLLMGLMDYIRFYIEKNNINIQKKYVEMLIKYRKKLRKLSKLSIFEYRNFLDFSKIVILTNNYISGKNLTNILYNRYNIVVEAALESHVILITSPADKKNNFSILLKALIEIDKNLSKPMIKNKLVSLEGCISQKSISSVISLGEVRFMPKIKMPMEDSIGKIAGENVILFPPGIPIICIGEQINNIHIEVIRSNLNNVVGVSFIDKVPYILVLEKC
ncbi:hypothetical protein AN641_02945 [Candidatus Epulonipiscioides gigas]|nr:hypothetical protein AN641_02945 [Epulopiscium sp. SCG-C07WGA-EpuloA2]